MATCLVYIPTLCACVFVGKSEVGIASEFSVLGKKITNAGDKYDNRVIQMTWCWCVCCVINRSLNVTPHVDVTLCLLMHC